MDDAHDYTFEPPMFFRRPHFEGQLLVTNSLTSVDGFDVRRGQFKNGEWSWAQVNVADDTAAQAAAAGLEDFQIYCHRTYKDRGEALKKTGFHHHQLEQFVANRVAQLVVKHDVPFRAEGDPFKGSISTAASKAISNVMTAVNRPMPQAIEALATLGVFKPQASDGVDLTRQSEIQQLMFEHAYCPDIDTHNEPVAGFQTGVYSNNDYAQIVGDWLIQGDSRYLARLSLLTADVVEHINASLPSFTTRDSVLNSPMLGFAEGTPVQDVRNLLDALALGVARPQDTQSLAAQTESDALQISVVQRCTNYFVHPPVVWEGVLADSATAQDADVKAVIAERGIKFGEFAEYEEGNVGSFYSSHPDLERMTFEQSAHHQYWLLLEHINGQEVSPEACADFADKYQLGLIDTSKKLPTLRMG